MKYKNFIWDFDATVFDTYEHTVNAMLRVLEETGRGGQHDREMVNRYFHINFTAARNYVGMTSQEDYKRFLSYHFEQGPEEKPVPWAKEILESVVKHGGRNFLFTLRNKTADGYLEAWDMAKYFTETVTSDNGFPNKPAPDGILYLMEKYHLVPEETIMVGDRELDGQSGRNAGIAGALANYYPYLPDGTNPADVSTMDYIAVDLKEFAEMMEIPLELA